MHEQYDINETATLRAFFQGVDGDPVDPTTITLTITLPDGSQVVKTKPQLTDDADVGRWSYPLVLTLNGVYTHHWASTVPELVQSEYFIVGASTDTGPCDAWISPEDVFAMKPASDVAEAERDYDRAADMAEAATRILFALSGSVYTGICNDVVRPCRRCEGWTTPYGWSWDASWGLCSCQSPSARACGCGSLDEIRLSTAPVLGVLEVRLDGVVLAPTAYRVDDGKWLVRTDGEGWPSCQDLTADPASDEQTFQVSYVFGRVPPMDGVLAAQRLAGDYYASAVGLDCALPANVQSLVRAGVQYIMGDPSQELKDGVLGLVEVDRFLTAERYSRSHRQTVIASPDMLPQVRRVE